MCAGAATREMKLARQQVVQTCALTQTLAELPFWVIKIALLSALLRTDCAHRNEHVMNLLKKHVQDLLLRAVHGLLRYEPPDFHDLLLHGVGLDVFKDADPVNSFGARALADESRSPSQSPRTRERARPQCVPPSDSTRSASPCFCARTLVDCATPLSSSS